MIISLIIFITSAIGILLFLIWKVPLLAKISSEKNPSSDFILNAKEKLEEGVKKEIKERFEELLHVILSNLRRFLVRVERITTKWLYTLRRKRKKRGEEK